MTREEFAKLAKGMRAVYTYPDFLSTKDSFDMWYVLLADLPYDLGALSLKSHMQTNSKVPTPADIRKGVVTLTAKEQVSDLAAWDMVRKAICRSGYYSEDEFDKLPELIQRVVGTPRQLYEWSQTTDGLDTVIASQFLRAYRTEQARERELAGMSEDIRKLAEASLPKIERMDKTEQIEERVEGVPMPERLKEVLKR